MTDDLEIRGRVVIGVGYYSKVYLERLKKTMKTSSSSGLLAVI
jgi:hypothetical protein